MGAAESGVALGTRVSENSRCTASEPGVWLHPLHVIKCCGLMRRIVGKDVISATGLDDILWPLLWQVTEYMNHPETAAGRWAADTAVIYICDKACGSRRACNRT